MYVKLYFKQPTEKPNKRYLQPEQALYMHLILFSIKTEHVLGESIVYR